MAINEEKTITNENTRDSNPDSFEAINQPQHDIIMKILRLEEGLLPEHKKILEDFAPNFMVNAEDLVRIQEALPTLTKLHDTGLLNDTMRLFESFLESQRKRIEKRVEIEKADKYLKQTIPGTITRKEQMMLLPFILNDFMYSVEAKWHPATFENGREVIRHPETNMDNAANSVFNSNKDRIKKTIEDALKAIEKNTEDDDFKNAFSHLKRDSMIKRLKKALEAIDRGNGAEIFKKAFIDFTNFCYEYNEGKTVGGHQQEKREKRNEESRLKFSQIAKAMWKERKGKG